MTRISIDDRGLRVQRSGVARWLDRSVDVPLEHVASVAEAEPAETRMRSSGIRVAGIQIPGVFTAGLFLRDGCLTWWDVRRSRRVLVITLRDERISKLVIELPDPAAVIRALDRASRGADPGSVERQA
jgi:hypothetical protein